MVSGVSLCLVVDEPLVVVPYDGAWPRRFQAERALLKRVLAPWLEGDIHHVGSTAVPDLAAKPIIDMMAGVRDLEEARAAFHPLRQHFYHYAPHRPGIAHHFAKPSALRAGSDYGLHLTEPGSDVWLERLAFRDTLRSDRSLAAEYEALKRKLAQEHGGDVVAYTAGKRAFVARVLARSEIRLGRR